MITFKPVDAAECNDAELVAQSLAGSREAYGHIVTRYQSLICSLNYSAMGDLGQSEDLAQETFVTGWKDLAKLREPAKLKSWLCRIARNLSYDALRKQGREPSHDAELLETAENAPATGPAPAERAISQEEQEILWRAIERIPELYREPLVLFYREQQSIQAVALHLDLSEDAVKQRLSRGRKLLQDEVTAFVEGALSRTSPGKVFTVAVLASLPVMTTSTKAAVAGATAAKGSATAKAAAAGGLLSAILSPLLIFFGNYAGYRMSLATAVTEHERSRIKSVYKRVLIVTGILSAVFLGFIGWASRDVPGRSGYIGVAVLEFMVVFIVTLYGFIIGTWRGRRRYLASLPDAEKNSPASQPAYEYKSRTVILGLPLIHVCIGDRFAPLKGPVRGWFAVGDVAVGGFFAFGGLAVAPFAIGGCAVGLVSFGGLAAGLMSIGGMSLGVWGYGGICLAWQALGGCAVAWNAAVGGIAVAHDYAMGAMAHAANFNTPSAQLYADTQWFFQLGRIISRYSLLMNLLWVAPMLLQWRVMAAKRARLAAAV